MKYKECRLCGRYKKLEEHHLIFGRGEREISEKYNLKIKICRECHTRLHRSKDLMDWSKKLGQRMFEKDHTREEFIKVFGRNYLDL